MKFFDEFYNKKITEEDAIISLRILISFVFRRLICEQPTNALNKIFSNLHKDIKEINQLDNSSSFSDSLQLVLYYKKFSSRFPNDKEFKYGLKTKNIETFKHKMFLFEELESYHNSLYNTNKYSLVHILPKKLTMRWRTDLGEKADKILENNLNKIGNFTLTTSNENLEKLDFNSKKKILTNESIEISDYLNLYETWGEEEINYRTDEMIKAILNIWPFIDSKLKSKLKLSSQENDFISLSDDSTVTGYKPYKLQVNDDTFSLSTWKSILKKICEISFLIDELKFKSFTGDSDFQGKKSKIFSYNKFDIREPLLIENTVYVETNLSANYILSVIKRVSEKMNFDLKDIKIWIR